MKIPYVNLASQYEQVMPELLRAIERTLRSGQYIFEMVNNVKSAGGSLWHALCRRCGEWNRCLSP
jgi:hypothetical protein